MILSKTYKKGLGPNQRIFAYYGYIYELTKTNLIKFPGLVT